MSDSYFEARERELLGEQYQKMYASAQHVYRAVTVNLLRTDAQTFARSADFLEGPAPFCPESFYLKENTRPGRHPYHHAGVYYVQEASAAAPAALLNVQPGDRVLDPCAAPGGKTTHIAELMNNKGKIYAFDVHEHKIELIKKNAERLGITIIEPKLSDGCKIDENMINTADKILCDVPCSGLGIIGRKPEIKWNRAEDNDLPKIQRQILDNASKYLKINGEIVYSTCTIEKEENEAVTDSFTADNENFEKVFEKTFYPHIDNTDGFYICKMKRIK